MGRVKGAAATAAVLLLSACSSPAAPDFVRISGRLPVIQGATLAGGSIGPSDYAGQIVVLNFWNQDCPPCRQEMPVLQRDVRALAGRGVVAIGVLYVGGNWPDDPAAARSFVDSIGVSYPNVVDRSSELARGLNIAGIPTTVVADRQGNLRLRVLGRLRPGQLEGLLAEMTSEA